MLDVMRRSMTCACPRRRRTKVAATASATTTSQIGFADGRIADGMLESVQPRLTNCSFQASCTQLTAP